MNTRKIIGCGIAVIAAFTIALAATACDDGNKVIDPSDGPQKVTYVSTDNNGNKYTLEIDESGGRSARSAARPGDTFKLTVEYTTVVGSGNLKMTFEYSGTVGAAQTSGASVSLTLNINGETITITIVGTQMTVITGRIVNDNGQEVVNNPGPVTPVNPTHTHSWGAWQSNAAQHWRECTANDGATTDLANHTGDPCTVCDYSSGSSGGPTTWTAVSTSVFGTDRNSISGVAYGNNTWVAGGERGKIAYSTDNGTSWTAVADSTFGTYAINDITYGNNMFIAVGDRGSMASSTDGRSWTEVNSPFGASIISGIAFGGGRWVIVGQGASTAYSTDGITWTLVSAGNAFGTSGSNGITKAVYGSAGNAGRFVIVGQGGKIAYSLDGASWTAVGDSTIGNNRINGIAFANVVGVGNRFVAVGEDRLAYSSDGASWTAVTPNPSFNGSATGIAFGNNRFVAVGNRGSMAYSADGADWTSIANSGFPATNSTSGSYLINAVAYGNGRFVAVGAEGKIAYADW